MTWPSSKTKDELIGSALVVAGIGLGGIGLLALLGFGSASTPIAGWRDHPFDLGNIRFTLDSWSWSARLWAYDPNHLFGWTPNVFYNPLATGAGAIFLGLFGEGSYRVFLVFLTLVTSLAFLPLIRSDGNGQERGLSWTAGGLLAGWLSMLVYPMDVGLLDANPVQVLYTGQWAQRLGVALGLFALERTWSALKVVDQDWRLATRRTLAAAALLGATLFTHFMSGYATVVAMGLLTVLQVAAKRLTRAWSWRSLLVLPAALSMMGLLFLDFLWVFFSSNASHHSLPLLGWAVPEGALATVREVIVPALPVLLIPLVQVVFAAKRTPQLLARAGLPLVVLAAVWVPGPAGLGLSFLVTTAGALVLARMEGGLRPVHWLPVIGMGTLWLACGPDSLRILGLDLSLITPFHSSLGWAKLAAFSRFVFLAWIGLLVVEGFRSPLLGKLATAGLAIAGLAVPLVLSATDDGRTGAQTFFGWMNQTDVPATRALEERMDRVAARTAPDGYLLVEDSLHHPDGSALLGRDLPHGHLPYRSGPRSGRPVLGGAVTTRWLAHPYAHTSRGQLLCQTVDDVHDADRLMDRLRALSISDVLAHSPGLERTLSRARGVKLVDVEHGLTHYHLEGHVPLLSTQKGLPLPGAAIAWGAEHIQLKLPADRLGLRLRQIWVPSLACTAHGPSGERGCKISSWREGPEGFADCQVGDPQAFSVDIPWIAVELDEGPSEPLQVVIRARPPAWPFALMLLAWLGAGVFVYLSRRKTPDQAR